MRKVATKVGQEPIPGYKLRKRLGAGGYGEVWLADAPGGLQKALKLIYGTVDESHAVSELKSLERIRQVNHPFLLSLERIEIADNQVVIVTELAEGSLLDRFELFRRRGEPGIPRAELLELLRDTADALDFLAQKHMLQHLDVKPGNLLIIADRVKVADFGLVKDLHDQNQSLVSGLTPTYSAPEIFDGRPDYRSDQYSLAIVYMEMLTGRLPFEGKTTGELARQHLNQPPDLEALPPADRMVVGRAMAKNPLDRFATCRLFIEQLQKTRGAVLPAAAPTDGATPGSDKQSQKTTTTTTGPKTCDAPAVNLRQQIQSRLDVAELASQWEMPRCMFIGLGEIGCQTLWRLHAELACNYDSRFTTDDHGWLALDTTSETLNAITDEDTEDALPAKHAIQLPIHRPSEYRNATPDLFAPLSRRWLYNIPKSSTTDGVRPLAILALLDHYEALKAKLKSELAHVVTSQLEESEESEPLRIYVLASLHGGTGGALASEIGLLVRQVFRELAYSNYRISFVATSATTANSSSANLPSAAALACLSELDYLMSGDHEIPPLFHLDRSMGSISSRPFDWVTLVDGGLHGSRLDAETAIRNAAQVVLTDSQTMLGAALSESRVEASQASQGWLRTACADRVRLSSKVTVQSLARWCSEQSLHHAAQYMVGPRGMATSSVLNMDEQMPQPTVSGDLPLTDQACQEFTRRLLHDLGVVQTHRGLPELAGSEEGDTLLSQWARRMSADPAIVARQLKDDVQIWKDSISKIVQLRVYNWKQVEQIQLNVIEGVLDYCEHETLALAKLFAPFSDVLGPPERLLQSAVSYLKSYAEECVRQLNRFQSEGKALAGRLRTWCNSINAEKAFNEGSWEVNVAGLPTDIQLLANRVNAVLETTLHQESIRILEGPEAEAESLGPDVVPLTPDVVNLQYVLSLASTLVSDMVTELGIDPDDLDGTRDNPDEGLSLKEIEEYGPIIAQTGGNVFRFAVVPQQQLQALKSAIDGQDLATTTTIIPAATSLGTYISCDASRLNVANVVASLWRPATTTLQLAERLRTRVDIDWQSVTELLATPELPMPDSELGGAAAVATSSTGVVSGIVTGGTAPIAIN